MYLGMLSEKIGAKQFIPGAGGGLIRMNSQVSHELVPKKTHFEARRLLGQLRSCSPSTRPRKGVSRKNGGIRQPLFFVSHGARSIAHPRRDVVGALKLGRCSCPDEQAQKSAVDMSEAAERDTTRQRLLNTLILAPCPSSVATKVGGCQGRRNSRGLVTTRTSLQSVRVHVVYYYCQPAREEPVENAAICMPGR